MFLTLSGRSCIIRFFSVIPRGISLLHSNALQYYVKRKKYKVNDVIFPSGCEACTINLDNKNMKIGIFIGGTSLRSKNIFTAISKYPTRKHEIKKYLPAWLPAFPPYPTIFTTDFFYRVTKKTKNPSFSFKDSETKAIWRLRQLRRKCW